MAIKKEIEISTIEKFKKHLEKLPKKELATKPIGEALEELKPTIEDAINLGYTREEILAMAAKNGIELKEYQLKQLFKKAKE
jgi:DNA-binding transcriptional regulator YhcF (GntR family)